MTDDPNTSPSARNGGNGSDVVAVQEIVLLPRGFDQFVYRPDSAAHLARERIALLEELQQLDPRVLARLRNEVLPIVLAGFPPDEAVEAWAQRWGLEAKWVMEAAHGTLRRWATPPTEARSVERTLKWSYPPSSGANALSVSEEQAWSRARHAHKSTAEWERLAGQRGWRRFADRRGSSEVRDPDDRDGGVRAVVFDGRRHITWLAKRLLGRSYTEIAKESRDERRGMRLVVRSGKSQVVKVLSYVDRTTVRDAVRTAAVRLGLPLPPSRSGRPRSRARARLP